MRQSAPHLQLLAWRGAFFQHGISFFFIIIFSDSHSPAHVCWDNRSTCFVASSLEHTFVSVAT
jgi:hypothetical protein